MASAPLSADSGSPAPPCCPPSAESSAAFFCALSSSTRESTKMQRHWRAALEYLWFGEHKTSVRESRKRYGSISLSTAFVSSRFPWGGLFASMANSTAKCWHTWTMKESRRFVLLFLCPPLLSCASPRDVDLGSVSPGSVLKEISVDSRPLNTICSASSWVFVFTPTSASFALPLPGPSRLNTASFRACPSCPWCWAQGTAMFSTEARHARKNASACCW
mmetsp:Transcript_22387/g.62879  ORF Transcript_22387/g.62879 Transcript_22387/m.62879 type:complete len:219 (-) Transcript_22387:2075-2731(-)